MDNQNESPQVQAPQPTPQLTHYPTGNQPKPKGRKLAIFTTILVMLLIGATGFLGYTYKKTNDTLKTQSEKLSETYKTVEKFQVILDEKEAADDFRAAYNNEALSRSQCGGRALMMSDVHVNDKFAVFRYLCENSSGPIRIASFKKLNTGAYEFAYGASTIEPNGLPGFIYDSEPLYFGQVYGARRF